MQLKGKYNLSLANPVYASDISSIISCDIESSAMGIDNKNERVKRLLERFEIVDLRQSDDFEFSHILGSHNFSNVFDVLYFIKKHAQKDILLVCYSGHTASILGTSLIESGLENIYYFDDYFAYFEELDLVEGI